MHLRDQSVVADVSGRPLDVVFAAKNNQNK